MELSETPKEVESRGCLQTPPSLGHHCWSAGVAAPAAERPSLSWPGGAGWTAPRVAGSASPVAGGAQPPPPPPPPPPGTVTASPAVGGAWHCTGRLMVQAAARQTPNDPVIVA